MKPEPQSSSISEYSHLKSELLQCIDDILGVENIRGCPCEELRDKVRENVFNLVVVRTSKNIRIKYSSF